MYASSDPGSSSGTELYVIDPVEATITVLRGLGAGGSWDGGSSYSGGGAGGSAGGGSGGSPGGDGGMGGLGGGGFGSLGGSDTPPAPPLTAGPTGDLANLGSPPLEDLAMVALSSSPQPTFDPDPELLPSPGPRPIPGLPPCTDCGGGEDDSNRLITAAAFTPSQVPEPASLALLGIALAGFGMMRRRKRA